MSRHERLCCVLCYALLGALTWAVFTHDPYPLLVLGVAGLAAGYAKETPTK